MGGIAGTASWLATYPIDYAKTLIQSQSIKSNEFMSAVTLSKMKYN